MQRLIVIGVVLGATATVHAQAWQDATADCLGTTTEWTNRVEVADVDGDGRVDLLLANGGDHATPGTAQPSRVWRNLGGWGAAGSHCTEISALALHGFTGHARVIKAIDVDGDGDLDLITGGAHQSQLRLYVREPSGWTNASAQLPQQLTSIGDLEAGDVDGDGDLDLVLAEWGATSPAANGYPGGRTRLYQNNGQGTFTDVTVTRMPDLLVLWSWDVELADVDGDWDLDALVACKLCTRSYLFRNDGTGLFTDDPDALPAAASSHELAAMDLDGDGDLDLVSVNDGTALRERLLINDGSGRFTDETTSRLTGTANPADTDDTAAVWLDFDGDADADLLIGGPGDDRLLINVNGVFTLATASTPADTPGTLGLAVADLDGDGRLDVLHGQGDLAFADKVQLATATIAVDVTPPRVRVEQRQYTSDVGVIHARVDDYQSPSRAHTFQRVWIEHDGYPARPLLESAPPAHVDLDMTWRGGDLWAAPALSYVSSYRVCATDRRNNSTCSDWVYVYGGGPQHDGPLPHGDGGPDTGTTDPDGSGCCDAGTGPGSSAVAALLVVVFGRLGRGRRRRQCQNPTETATLR